MNDLIPLLTLVVYRFSSNLKLDVDSDYLEHFKTFSLNLYIQGRNKNSYNKGENVKNVQR